MYMPGEENSREGSSRFKGPETGTCQVLAGDKEERHSRRDWKGNGRVISGPISHCNEYDFYAE